MDAEPQLGSTRPGPGHRAEEVNSLVSLSRGRQTHKWTRSCSAAPPDQARGNPKMMFPMGSKFSGLKQVIGPGGE